MAATYIIGGPKADEMHERIDQCIGELAAAGCDADMRNRVIQSFFDDSYNRGYRDGARTEAARISRMLMAPAASLRRIAETVEKAPQ